jgi:hypothetical protein
LIEKHKQLQERSAFKSFYQSEIEENKLYTFGNTNSYKYTKDYNNQEKKDLWAMSKVYVNPNYTSKKNVIHINPHVQVKSSIYINPKLIKNMASTQNQEQSSRIILQNNQSIIHTNIQNKCSVHVNPKLMNRLISKVSEKNNLVQSMHNISNQLHLQNMSNISAVTIDQTISNCSPDFDEKSFHPFNIKKQSAIYMNPVNDKKLSTNYIIKSKTKLVNNGYNFRKSSSSNLVALSQKKLVRIKKSPKLITATNTSKTLILSKKKSCSSGIKKLKNSHRNVLNTRSQLSKINNIKLVKNIDKYKINWSNKVDKSILKSSKKKLIAPKKVM